MRKIWTIFTNDIQHLFKNTVTIVILCGLILLPSIFTWYNIMACWNVFDNTGNLKIAVASADKGYKSDLFPLEVNIGETVISELRGNDQIDWTFTTEEDAIEGTKSGAYYAAVVIPETFSEDMLSFYSDEGKHAQLIYYCNEKINAISPRITGTGASTVSYQVNETFAETLSKISITIAQSLSTYAGNNDANSKIAALSDSIRTMGNRLGQASSVLSLYSTLAVSSSSLVSSSAEIIGTASQSLSDATAKAESSLSSATTTVDEMKAVSEQYPAALDQAANSMDKIIEDASKDPSVTEQSAEETAQEYRNQSAAVAQEANSYQAVADELSKDPETNAEAIEQTQETADTLTGLKESLDAAAAEAESGSVSDDARQQVIDQANASKSNILSLKDSYYATILPAMDALSADLSTLQTLVASSSAKLQAVNTDLSSSVSKAGASLSGAASTLAKASSELGTLSNTMYSLSNDIDSALSNADSETLKKLLGSDSAELASMLASPVNLERDAVYSSENFGSGMSPLYTAIALFVGNLLIMVLLKPKVTGRCLEDLPKDDYKPRHFFLGRGLTVFLISFVQATVMGLGNLFFLGVQVTDPLLYMLTFWVTSFLFSIIAYTLVLSFVNLGKAFLVLLLIIQVTGCGGSYPLQILPDFVQFISPFLPATHVVNAMRAAMMGVYMNDFWIEIVILLGMSIPFWLLGLVLRKPTIKLMDWYVGKVEESKMIV